ncbi:MAG TPA: TPM domain-containing protein [Thermoanaerobaculia bacterium]|nr:TPM domain-containing protein [Thermoanaerobaculia bacterium]
MKDDCRTPRVILRVASLVLLFAIAAVPLIAKEIPPPPNRWLTDTAGLISPTEADILNRKLSDFEQQTGAQFIIYIFKSLEGDSLERFTISAAEKWKVGQKKYDNGLILFVFAEDRRARIEVGYGLEGTITDAVSSRVIREFLAPRFQQGDYAGGLNAAADELMRRIRTGEKPVEPLQSRRSGEREDLGIIPILILLFIIFFVIAPMFARRRSGCGGCLLPLLFSGGGVTFGGGHRGGGFGGFGGGGFSGGGGSFGGGGASGSW